MTKKSSEVVLADRLLYTQDNPPPFGTVINSELVMTAVIHVLGRSKSFHDDWVTGTAQAVCVELEELGAAVVADVPVDDVELSDPVIQMAVRAIQELSDLIQQRLIEVFRAQKEAEGQEETPSVTVFAPGSDEPGESATLVVDKNTGEAFFREENEQGLWHDVAGQRYTWEQLNGTDANMPWAPKTLLQID